jgi:hypothetical protein
MAWHREAFYALAVQNVTEFDSDQCSVFCLLDKEKEREEARGFFPRDGGQTHLPDYARWDFRGCWVQLKADLWVSI